MSNIKIEGFSALEPATTKPRIVEILDGKEKKGKTHHALTAPDPIAALVFDAGFESTAKKFVREGKQIIVNSFMETKCEMEVNKDQKFFQDIWARFKKQYVLALKHPDIRTIIVDTFTEVWELCRFSHFGGWTAKAFKSEMRAMMYGIANNDFRNLMNWAMNPTIDKNVIFIQKVKPIYIEDKRTGEYESAGFGDAGYVVDLVVRVDIDKKKGPYSEIIDCREDLDFRGQKFEGPLSEFKYIASTIYPEVGLDYWE